MNECWGKKIGLFVAGIGTRKLSISYLLRGGSRRWRGLAIAVIMVVGIVVGAAGLKPARAKANDTKKKDVVRVVYKAWNGGVEVDIQHKTLKSHTIHYKYSKPTSAVPVGSTSEGYGPVAISSDQVQRVIKVLEESGFYDLEPAYGAPEDQRFYPYSITVYFSDGTSMKVVYRSNPSYDPPPEAFKKVEKVLFSLKPGGGK